jgi:hypothetical protein
VGVGWEPAIELTGFPFSAAQRSAAQVVARKITSDLGRKRLTIRVARFFLIQQTKMLKKATKMNKIARKYTKMASKYRMTMKYVHQDFPSQGPPKLTQISILV